MPVVKQARLREKYIDQILRNRNRRYTVMQIKDELSRKLGTEISKETVYKDLRHIREEYEAVISTNRHNQVYYEDPEFTIEKTPLTEEDKNLLMYCTGGIRCEKASAYYKHKGFKNVFQLEGGIIEYTRQVNILEIENKFIGKNFVFDDRRAEKITDDVIAHCHQCGKPADTHTNCANEACHLLFIQCDECSEKTENTCSTACQEMIHLPYETQKELRKGKHASNKIFKKGRSEVLPFKS